MENKRKIPYGVINWAELVRECFVVDNTRYIRELETIKTPVFLRPKRFGKSVVCSMLAHYYDIDLKECSITMEPIKGPSVKSVLDDHPEMADDICRKIGTAVARLHSAGICHGDLTTSNMILEGGEICLIDFSMGIAKAELEDIGVDLRLLERAFSSAHVGLESSFEILMDTYYSNIDNAKQVKKKLNDIKNRARYT